MTFNDDDVGEATRLAANETTRMGDAHNAARDEMRDQTNSATDWLSLYVVVHYASPPRNEARAFLGSVISDGVNHDLQQ